MDEYEAAIDPARPIIDPHLHLWEIHGAPGSPREPQRFFVHEAAEAIAASGHTVTHTVFVECNAMCRPDGPEEFRSLGETEFATGMAAMSASGNYGKARINHRIVGDIDLRGSAVDAVLDAHVSVASERFRGIRVNVAYSPHGLFGYPCNPALGTVLGDPGFVAGARVLAARGFSLDIWCLHSQIAQVATLADTIPHLPIVLDHLGTPDPGTDRIEAMNRWRTAVEALAQRPNVKIKLGGMGMDLSRSIPSKTGNTSSEQLAEAWRERVETCIAAFSPARAMFESNFPPDKAAGSYGATWNAFKRIARQYSQDEQDCLFRRSAAQTYRIALD